MMRKIAFSAACLLLAACGQPVGNNLASDYQISGLYAPWDSLENTTSLRCRCDRDYFHFEFTAADTTLTVAEDYQSEMSVDFEDRVELFFSPDSLMSCYHCMEIDPLGRAMDYEISYYRNFMYEWNFSTLESEGELIDGGYIVRGKVSLDELRSLGIPTDGKPFWFGVFQADFKPDGTVNWYSRVKTADVNPDFHKPDVLYKARIII